MSEIVESLFGVSPERYRQQQDIALQREALDYAKLDPYQRATAGIYAGARGLASGIGRMLGGEDPGMRRVTEQDQIIRSINLNDPETFGPAAQRAYQMGHTELAQKILLGADTAYQRQEATRKRAADMQTRQQTQAAQQLIPSLMTPGQPEQVMIDEAADTSYLQKAQAAGIDQNILRQLMATPAGRAELKSYIDTQEAMQGPITPVAEGGSLVRQNRLTGSLTTVATGAAKLVTPPSLGSDFNRFAGGMFPGVPLSALTGAQIEAVNNRIDAEKTKNAAAGAPKLTVQDKRNEMSLRELDVPRAKEFSESAASARRFAGDAEVIANLLRGKGGGTVVKVASDLARSFGLQSDTITANDLANSLATRGAVAIRAPGSGSTSDIEFKAYLAAFPSLSNSESGRDLMAKYAKEFSKRSSLLADHARKLIRDDKYSEGEIARYDESLGKVLNDEFYNFSRVAATPGAANARSAAAGAGLIAAPAPAPAPQPAPQLQAPAPAPMAAPVAVVRPQPAPPFAPAAGGLLSGQLATPVRPVAAPERPAPVPAMPSGPGAAGPLLIPDNVDWNTKNGNVIYTNPDGKKVNIGKANTTAQLLELVKKHEAKTQSRGG